jgi:hypothetical protein
LRAPRARTPDGWGVTAPCDHQALTQDEIRLDRRRPPQGARHRGNGDSFGSYGIEIDATTPLSPSGTQVLARIPRIFGPGESAEMSYHVTPAGAKVFAAGALDFGGSALRPPITRLLENLWAHLSQG